MSFPHLPNWRHLPRLPRGAAYMTIDNRKVGNALTMNVIRNLKKQIIDLNTSTRSGRSLFLPPFKPPILSRLEKSMEKYQRTGEEDEYTWLVSSKVWAREREGLPRMIVLASGNDGVNFCSGHSIHEIRHETRNGTPKGVKEIFEACGELMGLIRRSPVLVAARVKGNAHGAGVQLAFATDLPIAHKNLYKNILPGRTLGFPCTSPGVVLGRSALRTPHEVMGALIDGELKFGLHQASSPPDTVDLYQRRMDLDDYLVKKVKEILQSPTQPMAMAKWAAYTQMSLRGQNHLDADGKEAEGCGGDGLEDALAFAARVMTLHAQSEDAEEAMDLFIYKSYNKHSGRKTSLADDLEEGDIAKKMAEELAEMERLKKSNAAETLKALESTEVSENAEVAESADMAESADEGQEAPRTETESVEEGSAAPEVEKVAEETQKALQPEEDTEGNRKSSEEADGADEREKGSEAKRDA